MAVTLGLGLTFNDGSTQLTQSASSEAGGLISITTFTAVGTYTIPTGATTLLVKCVGGGGGAAGYLESGGGGGYAEGYFNGTAQGVIPGNTVAVTVGGGGASVYYYAAAGNGHTSTFGGWITATGGHGANSQYGHTGGFGGQGSGGIVSLIGGGGTGHGNHHGYAALGRGGASYFGGGNGVRHYHDGGSHAYYPAAIGAGAAGGTTDGNPGPGNAGRGQWPGMGGMVVVYAYQ